MPLTVARIQARPRAQVGPRKGNREPFPIIEGMIGDEMGFDRIGKGGLSGQLESSLDRRLISLARIARSRSKFGLLCA